MKEKRFNNCFCTIIVGALIILFMPVCVEARRGCCSHHGGVCGCTCCDGTSLSAKCSPYYPACSENKQVSKAKPAAKKKSKHKKKQTDVLDNPLLQQ